MRKYKLLYLIVAFVCVLMTIRAMAGGWSAGDVQDTAVIAETHDKKEQARREIRDTIEKRMTSEDFDADYLSKQADMDREDFDLLLTRKPSGHRDVGEVVRRAVGCMQCHQGKYVEVQRTCSNWSTTGNQVRCAHFNFGVDIERKRCCSSIKRCDVCFYEISGAWEETDWYCTGFNRLP